MILTTAHKTIGAFFGRTVLIIKATDALNAAQCDTRFCMSDTRLLELWVVLFFLQTGDSVVQCLLDPLTPPTFAYLKVSVKRCIGRLNH